MAEVIQSKLILVQKMLGTIFNEKCLSKYCFDIGDKIEVMCEDEV